ncbi:MAG TPA: ABC transporter transmembrane domain-containing protein, partial [Gemmataceae bacterium]|nr:ABC transporter transmembrane domain-containing protein [Gemmataceae bacterium]
MERSAFSRAWDYVGYTPAAKWMAMITAAATAVVHVALLVVLFLFADLIISRGQFPEYSELTDSERQQFKDEWRAMVPETRLQAVQDFPVTHDPAVREIVASTADKDWDAPGAAPKRWKIFIGQWLQSRIGPYAANEYRSAEGTFDAEAGKAKMGFLSLVFRNRHHFSSGPLAWLGRHNSWMWRPATSSRANIPYLTGLFALTAVLALWQLALISISNRAATIACLEAVTRLRRLLYHHSYRLGSSVFKSTGTNEAISMFTRHVEAVHDG